MKQMFHQLPPWDHPFFAVTFFLFGICVGSFMNVVIYRVPRAISINDPKRSFCPNCKKEIPMWRNIPLFTWLWQRGKCAECQASIAPRYFWIELLTGLLWLTCWYAFPTPLEAIFYMIMGTIGLVICAIDIELMVIPRVLTATAAVIALAGAALMPWKFGNPYLVTWQDGLLYSAFGLCIGWFSLWLIVLLGKLIFGKQEFTFDEPTFWQLKEPENENEEFSFVIGDQAIPWSDIFFRKTDKIIISSPTNLKISGKTIHAKSLEIHETFILVDGNRYDIENITSLSGKTTSAIIPREAMGMGDVDLLAVLGATFGAPSLILIILFACVFTMLIALFGKLGFSKMIPFGPALIAGGVFWLCYGQQAWQWYLQFFSAS